ncbi:DUF6510 family protein [Streptomyces sp. NPDC004031]
MNDAFTRLDGNALAGPLSAVLAADPTTAWRSCPNCRLTGTMAQLHLYGPDPGLTGRCPGCGVVALRFVEQPHHLWLQLGSGGGAFRFDRPPGRTRP